MPLGKINSLATYRKAINIILDALLFAHVYFDEVVIFLITMDEYLQRIEKYLIGSPKKTQAEAYEV